MTFQRLIEWVEKSEDKTNLEDFKLTVQSTLVQNTEKKQDIVADFQKDIEKAVDAR